MSHAEDDTAPASLDFEPPINLIDLDSQVVDERREWDHDLAAVNAGWATHATPRLQACQYAIDQLARFHAEIVDGTDIDLSAETRWVAILASTSRCIAVADALVDQLRRGYASETAGTARVLHEALDLAVALAGGDEQQARRWLRGKQYPQREASRERTAYFARVLESSARRAELEEAIAPHLAGAEAEAGRVIKDVADAISFASGRVYGALSAGAHNLRRGFADGISVSLRRFTYGRHPAVGVRGTWIEIGEGLIEQTCLDVSACLAEIVGIDAVRETTMTLVGQLQEVRERFSFT